MIMMKEKLVVFLAVAMAASLPLCAQDAEYAEFQKAATHQSVLYRGRAAQLYSGTLYNGHFYWTSPEFRTGSVVFNGKTYSGVLLNIDACAQDLLAKSQSGAPAVIVARDVVPEFFIGDEHYVNLFLEGVPGAVEGYYRIACEQPLVYHRVNKVMQSSTNNVNGSGIGYEDPGYRTDVFNYFMKEERFYVVKDGALKKIGKRKARKIIAAAIKG